MVCLGRLYHFIFYRLSSTSFTWSFLELFVPFFCDCQENFSTPRNLSILRKDLHCVKSVRIRSFSGLYFPTFGTNTETHGLPLRIQSECGEIRTKKLRIRTLFTQCLIIKTTSTRYLLIEKA